MTDGREGRYPCALGKVHREQGHFLDVLLAGLVDSSGKKGGACFHVWTSRIRMALLEVTDNAQ